MPVYAKLRYLRQSPKKVRLVAQVIKGMQVKTAQSQLRFSRKRAAQPLFKLLNSVIANARHNYNLKEDNLYIKEIKIDEGPSLKRWMPRAFGRAAPIRKKSSHITIILDEIATRKAQKDRKSIKDLMSLRSTKGGFTKSAVTKLEKSKMVKNLDEVKKFDSKEPIKSTKVSEEPKEEHQPPTRQRYAAGVGRGPFDVRRKGKDRKKQHLDQLKKKREGGLLKRIFRRKSV